MRKFVFSILAAASFAVAGTAVASPQVWNGPSIAFAKAPGTDPTLAENQDRLTGGVWLTRSSSGGIYNVAPPPAGPGEIFFGISSPAGTAWAFSGLDSNPSGAAFGASHYGNLHFTDWAGALGGSGLLLFNILDRPGVLHLTAEDVYIDITFTAFGSARSFPSSAGAFAYTRTTASPVPAPAALLLFAPALTALLGWRRQAPPGG